MSTTCGKCGYENRTLPKASVCPKCATPYAAHRPQQREVPAGMPAAQLATAGAATLKAGPAASGVSPLRAMVGGGVLLVLIAVGIGAMTASTRQAEQRAAQAQRDWAQRVETAITQHQVLIGMTADQVRRAWGEPSAINETIRAGSVSQQWVYRRSGWTASQLVYLEDGVVRTLQTLQ